MRPIPLPLRRQLEATPRMHRCMLAGYERLYGRCDQGRPEWHHVFIYAGSQINEAWAIMSACHTHHEEVKKDRAIKQAFETASLLIATDEDLAKYPKKDWDQLKIMLGIKKRNGRQKMRVPELP